MDKIKLNLFDAFAFLLPGLTSLYFIVVLFADNVNRIKDIASIDIDLNIGQISIVLVVAYLFGIMINSVGHQIYQLAKWMWKGSVQDRIDNGLTDSEIHVIIRELAPNNHYYLESWLGLSNMSHNIATSFILGLAVSVVKAFNSESVYWHEWFLISFVMVVGVVVFLKRSIRFNNFFKKDSSSVIQKLNLKAKASEYAKL